MRHIKCPSIPKRSIAEKDQLLYSTEGTTVDILPCFVRYVQFISNFHGNTGALATYLHFSFARMAEIVVFHRFTSLM